MLPFRMPFTRTVSPQNSSRALRSHFNQPWVLLRLICIVHGDVRRGVGLPRPPPCADSCFLTGNQHPMARLVYVALQWDCLLCLCHGHRDNLTPARSLIACPLCWQDQKRGGGEKSSAISLMGLTPSESTLI